jgi:RNA polymerase sigma-70 factor, ECF subfamily
MEDQASHDSTLWIRIRSGDEAAFESLFRAYFDELCSFSWRYVRSTVEAQDLVQDVFVSLWHRRAGLNMVVPVRPYLYAAVRNESLKVLEHRDVVRRAQDIISRQSSFAPMPDEELTYDLLARTVQRIIAALPVRRREIFVLHRQHDLTYREIADLLGISVRTVETHIARALDAFRAELRKESIAAERSFPRVAVRPRADGSRSAS